MQEGQTQQFTAQATTATDNIVIPNGISIIQASATIELTNPGAKAMFMDGEKVERIVLNAGYGSGTEVSYFLKSGKKIVVN